MDSYDSGSSSELGSISEVGSSSEADSELDSSFELNSGYECNFVSEPDDSLKCLICLAVARDPWQHGKCGRLFCRSCLFRLPRDEPCPNCRIKKPKYMEDNKSKRLVKTT